MFPEEDDWTDEGRFDSDFEEYEDLIDDPDGWNPELEMDDLIDGVGFANPGSALRAATPDNPRSYPCPTCGAENILTRLDVARGYQCDNCADVAEGGR